MDFLEKVINSGLTPCVVDERLYQCEVCGKMVNELFLKRGENSVFHFDDNEYLCRKCVRKYLKKH